MNGGKVLKQWQGANAGEGRIKNRWKVVKNYAEKIQFKVTTPQLYYSAYIDTYICMCMCVYVCMYVYIVYIYMYVYIFNIYNINI